VARLRRVRSVSTAILKALVALVLVVLIVIGLALAAIETGWAKNQIRRLIVRQANQYLTATLEIGRLEGSLLRGIQLGDVRLSRAGHSLVNIDEISLSYSVRELLQPGVVIRRIRLTRPRIAGAKQPDGRWDLGALVKRELREEERTGPRRPIEIQSIEVVDGRVMLGDPLDFGAAHVPTDFQSLNATLSFAYYPVRWQLNFGRVAWVGHAPDLTVTRLAGAFGRGPGGWFFDRFLVETPRSAFTLAGHIDSETKPTRFDLQVRASRFAFQEWSGVLRGLKNIAVDAAFDTSLTGPTTALAADLRLAGTGGSVNGQLTLDTTVPGWHGAGAVDIAHLDLARWLNRPDRPSDITGHVTFNLALELGRHFPRGVYTFDGPHAMYMNYAADDVQAHGQITAREVLVAKATALAYGANVTTADGSIGVDEPFPYRFVGTAAAVDLRRVPVTVPVPHVDSVLTFDYDIAGRFRDPFIVGHATFRPSQFLGATIGAGTVGMLDTSQKPLRFSGDGEVDRLDLHRLGEGLEVAWLQNPRYAGTVAGRFRVEGAGTDRRRLALTAGGRLARGDLFRGTLSDADVSLAIERGTLRASYDGRFSRIDPAVAFAEPRLEASLSGAGRVTATVRDLLIAEKTTLADYDVSGTLALQPSTVRDLALDRAELDATLRDSTLAVNRLDTTGPAIEGRASGSLAFDAKVTTTVAYDLSRLDLSQLRSLTGRDLAGVIATKGQLTGPSDSLHAVGDATVSDLDAFAVNALTLRGHYDVTTPADDLERMRAGINGEATFLKVLGGSIQSASGTIAYDAQRLTFDLALVQAEGRRGNLAGTVVVMPGSPRRRETQIADLTVTLGGAPWRLAHTEPSATITWTDAGVAVTPVEFVGGNGDERLGAAGTWRPDGSGALRVTGTHVFLETLQNAFERPARYGGVVDLDATIRGTREEPIVTGRVTVSNGRVERVTYRQLSGRVDYTREMFTVDFTLDQAPGVTLTAAGTVPLALFNHNLPERPLDVRIRSSAINLGLIEGVTDVVRNVSGEIRLDVHAVGTSHDPHFEGSVVMADAAFLVTSTGSRYRNARASIALSRDRVMVETLHVEDSGGRALELHGGLGTHELRVGELEVDATASHFELLRNQLGRIDVDASLRFRGRFETPRVTGDLTINGGDLKVDEILERTLFRPYATEPVAMTEVDAVAALNPWDRLGLELTVHVPALRLIGTNVQISPGTPIGLGDIGLRVGGDLYLYKDPDQPLSVTGSLDRIAGTYAFQGRRFDVVQASSINFHGDLDPEVYVTVTRIISGVETRVTIAGPLHQPELRLASTPPLDSSDILSLIVFGTSTNQLTAPQQQELVVRAGALAAGFLATPIVSAIENEIGLDVLAIEPPSGLETGPRVTVGQEIAPGLVAQFSRQFGQEPYDEATLEFYLSRILRLRATFSDAQSLEARSPFRRIERAGIDLLFFFSF
jgi:autotransporter translocation and assembly factor TamB